MKTTAKLALFRSLLLIVATAWSMPSRADIPPACDVLDALITCDAADVGKACQGGGQCYAVVCGTTTSMTLYKCDTCPTILSAPDAGCAPSNFGTACGDGGVCRSIQAYCTSSTKYVCAGPATGTPTGPPAGESGGAGGSIGAGGSTGSGGSTGAGGGGGTGVAVCPSCKSTGGCDVAPRATGPGAIALGLLTVGMIALLYDRRRKRRR